MQATESRGSAAAGTDQLSVRAFASTEPLSRGELLSAPLRWPRPSRLGAPLRAPGKRAATALRALGLETVGDLLEHLPSSRRQASAVAELREGEQATVSVQVRHIAARPVRRRRMRPLVEARVADASGTIRATFFNQPWLVDRYKPGTRLLLHGRADGRGGFRVTHHAMAEGGQASAGPADDGLGGEGLGAEGLGGAESVAHYPASEGISSTQILTLVRAARSALADVPEPLSAALRSAERLPDRAGALAAMHFPRDGRDTEAGRRRLAYEELLLAQLTFLRRREERRRRGGAHKLDGPPALSARWLERGLPFAPTGDQRRAIATIEADLAEERQMQRLLMGEVGSGKTVVALHAMLRAVEHGLQAALMAPTETLAEQHFTTIQRLLGGEPVSAALLTGSTPARRRRDVLGKLASGELSLLVGTHALIEPEVRFRALAVAVIDEQHRFGVRQRSALEAHDPAHPPHTLHMTATPIPRTLALAGYGDLDVSALHELPAGRRPIRTELLAGEQGRARAYERLREQLRTGRQGFVVCPLVEEPEEGAAGSDQRAARGELARLREGELRGFRLELLHGGMPAADKQGAMERFAGGQADVLVATTVIEVGIDVPNATVMVVENAERFGISQLHQLRGRVGRGEHASSCFLIGGEGAHGSARLRALAEHADGFRLAEIDLALRKEGELIGTRQSGAQELRVACVPEDAALLERARARAEAIVARDPELRLPEHALLAGALVERFGAGALAPLPA